MTRLPLLILTLALCSLPVAATASSGGSASSIEQTINSLLSTGYDQAQADQLDEAYETFREASELANSHFGKRSMEVARTNLTAGSVLVDTPAFAKAKRFLISAHKSFNKHSGPESIETAMAAFELGTYNLLRNRERTASLLLESSLPAIERSGAYSTMLMENHVLLVNAYERMGKHPQSQAHLRVIGELIAQGQGESFRAKPVYAVHPSFQMFSHCYSASIAVNSSGSLPACSSYGANVEIELAFDVNEKGEVVHPRVKRVEGDSMQVRHALRAVEKFRYAPEIVDGQAVGLQNLTYTFTSPR